MKSQELIKVWDLPLRIFHWLLVAGFFVAYLTEDELLTIHVWAGYLVFGLLLFRLAWGFIGNEYARFSNFLCSPVKSVVYIKDVIALKAKRYLGHNPGGRSHDYVITGQSINDFHHWICRLRCRSGCRALS